jgi:hypothetical protein
MREHQSNAFGRGRIVFDEQNAHGFSPDSLDSLALTQKS